ncbi:MAG: Lrp/AsnC family transcriptional regulator [Nanoarchaeota archaeon]|nr:Lrp/AsnC family transcriptional regulator [Nanoarchaeota archaeon]
MTKKEQILRKERMPAAVIAPEKEVHAELSKKDREIINILTMNSRTPLSQIAKYLKTSAEVINYHYNGLRKRNIITDAFTFIDPKVLGIQRYCVYLQFHALSQERMKNIIEDFLSNKHVNWVIETGGKWEFILMFETLNQNKYDEILDSITSPIKDYLNDYSVVTVKSFIHKSQRYIKGLKSEEEYRNRIKFPYDKELKSKKAVPAEIDEKDIWLLKLIHEDSRLTLTDLGEKLNLSRHSVDYRIKKLIAAGIIKSFLIRLNYHLLDFQYTTIMIKFRSISKNRMREFLNHIYADERFYALMEQIGMWDLSLMMFFSNPKDLRNFLISLKEKFSDVIHSYESVIHFDQHYYTQLCDGVIEELIEKSKVKK